MKNQFTLILIALIVICSSCSKEEIDMLPLKSSCQLTSLIVNQSLPSIYITDNGISHYKDSIVNIIDYNGEQRKNKYIIDEVNHKIYFESIKSSDQSLVSYGTYYLNQAGLLDSIVRYNGLTDVVNFRNRFLRNSKNKITYEYNSYITYGRERNFFYDANGNIDYEIYVGFGTQSHRNDSVLYTHDLSLENNGSPEYVLQELNGNKSKHHVTRMQFINRTSGDLIRELRYNFEPLDANGNITNYLYEIDQDPDVVIGFDADYIYERKFEYVCSE